MYNGANLEGDPRLEKEENGKDFFEPTHDYRTSFPLSPAMNHSHPRGLHILHTDHGKVTFDDYLAAARRQRQWEDSGHGAGDAPPTPDSASQNE